MGQHKFIPTVAPPNHRLRVIIADPYPVILHGLRQMVENDGRFQVVAAVATMPLLADMVVTQRAEVALIDCYMASQCTETTARLLASDRATSIIFLTASDDPAEKQLLHGLGADEFLSKWCSTRKLRTAIWKAGRKLPPRPRIAAKHAGFSEAASEDPAQCIMQLTKRERELLPLVCSGLKNKEIAVRLGIAESTVWHHLTSVFTKLAVEDRLGLAAFAYRHQLVQAHDGSLAANASAEVGQCFWSHSNPSQP